MGFLMHRIESTMHRLAESMQKFRIQRGITNASSRAPAELHSRPCRNDHRADPEPERHDGWLAPREDSFGRGQETGVTGKHALGRWTTRATFVALDLARCPEFRTSIRRRRWVNTTYGGMSLKGAYGDPTGKALYRHPRIRVRECAGTRVARARKVIATWKMAAVSRWPNRHRDRTSICRWGTGIRNFDFVTLARQARSLRGQQI
jgi:hypothetical protein